MKREQITRIRDISLWLACGVAYGLLLRIVFGALPSDLQGVMSLGFLIGTPIAVGAITVYGYKGHLRSIWYSVFAPWATVSLIMIGCALTFLEGSICIAMMLPLFFVCSSVGGVAMHFLMKWTPNHRTTLNSFAVLPFVIAIGESTIPQSDSEHEIRRSITVAAPDKVVWNEIVEARDIAPSELPISITHLIGVPKPLEGVNVSSSDGDVRYSKWERGVHFRARIVHKNLYRSNTWAYEFEDDSFPPGSMDDHVKIGGAYFNLGDTTFNLHPISNIETRLEVVAHYRVTSSINFYAVPLAKLLGHDFLNMLLGFYKNRSEHSALNYEFEAMLGAAHPTTQSAHLTKG